MDIERITGRYFTTTSSAVVMNPDLYSESDSFSRTWRIPRFRCLCFVLFSMRHVQSHPLLSLPPFPLRDYPFDFPMQPKVFPDRPLDGRFYLNARPLCSGEFIFILSTKVRFGPRSPGVRPTLTFSKNRRRVLPSCRKLGDEDRGRSHYNKREPEKAELPPLAAVKYSCNAPNKIHGFAALYNLRFHGRFNGH